MPIFPNHNNGNPSHIFPIEQRLLPLRPQEKRMEIRDGDNDLVLYWVTVDAERANALLDINTRNRSLKVRQMDRYARDMAEGNWPWNGSTICVSSGDEPVLLDGQTRLSAVLESGTPIRSIVVVGLPHHAQDEMDSGSKRSFSDSLKIAGEINVNNLAALVKADLMYQAGQLVHGSRYQPTRSELQKHLDGHPEIRDVLQIAQPAIRKFSITNSYANLAALLFYRLDEQDCADFWRQLATIGVARNEAIMVLQDTLMKRQADDRKGKKTNPLIKLALIIKAWNAYRSGQHVALLKYTIGGSNPETFPEPI